MAHTIHTQIEIPALPAEVWAALIDFTAYPDWNPFIPSIKGRPAPGAMLDVTLTPAPKKQYLFRAKVVELEQNKVLAWEGSLGGLPSVFCGRHRFELIPQPGRNSTLLVHSEKFSGILAGVMMPFMRRQTEQGFESMNNALKLRLAQQGRAA